MIDLEDAIMATWQTSQDLDLIYNSILDKSVDEMANALLGIKCLHEMRMEQLYDAYKREFKLDEYCTNEKTLKNREKVLKAMAKVIK